MITFQSESMAEILPEMKEIVFDHAKETDHYQEYFQLDPDYDFFLESDEVGNLVVVSARDDGELVGYLLFFLNYNPHYKEILYAVNDLIYIKPGYRRAGIAPQMFEFAENLFKELGVKVITFHMKAHLPFEELADRMGYDKAEIMYTKYLGDKE